MNNTEYVQSPATTSTALYSTPTVPLKRKLSGEQEGENDTGIFCRCGVAEDDGFSIGCDQCLRWVHAVCFGITRDNVPDQWWCWMCRPPNGESVYKKKGGGRGKRRRASTSTTHHSEALATVPEHSWGTDVFVHKETKEKLVRLAGQWRGVSSFVDSIPPSQDQRQFSSTSSSSSPPPRDILRTTHPTPRHSLITPFVSTITPSADYLADTVNGYAHMSCPKNGVHLLGPPLDLCLDARWHKYQGVKGKDIRAGCWPNAILKPIVVPGENIIKFGIFALEDLRANEEVVLGWEWDDGSVVHELPQMLRMDPNDNSALWNHRINQLANILHSIDAAYPYPLCACATTAHEGKGCVIDAMRKVVDNFEGIVGHPHYPLGPLVGESRGFRATERYPGSGGWGGCVPVKPMDDEDEMVDVEILDSNVEPEKSDRRAKGKSKPKTRTILHRDEDDSPSTHPKMRLRKEWKSSHTRKESSGEAIDLPPSLTFQRVETSASPSQSLLEPLTPDDGIRQDHLNTHLHPPNQLIDSSVSPTGLFSQMSLLSPTVQLNGFHHEQIPSQNEDPGELWIPLGKKDQAKENSNEHRVHWISGEEEHSSPSPSPPWSWYPDTTTVAEHTPRSSSPLKSSSPSRSPRPRPGDGSKCSQQESVPIPIAEESVSSPTVPASAISPHTVVTPPPPPPREQTPPKKVLTFKEYRLKKQKEREEKERTRAGSQTESDPNFTPEPRPLTSLPFETDTIDPPGLNGARHSPLPVPIIVPLSVAPPSEDVFMRSKSPPPQSLSPPQPSVSVDSPPTKSLSPSLPVISIVHSKYIPSPKSLSPSISIDRPRYSPPKSVSPPPLRDERPRYITSAIPIPTQNTHSPSPPIPGLSSPIRTSADGRLRGFETSYNTSDASVPVPRPTRILSSRFANLPPRPPSPSPQVFNNNIPEEGEIPSSYLPSYKNPPRGPRMQSPSASQQRVPPTAPRALRNGNGRGGGRGKLWW